MKFKINPKVLYYLKKYPSLRLVSIAGILVLFFLILVFFTTGIRKAPQLYAINPQIANAGDAFTLTGQHFGHEQKNSYVEIAGSPLTQSCYTSWSQNKIELKLPANVQDGLVYVVTKAGRSEPKNFTNRQSIPILVKKDIEVRTPYISSVAEKNPSVGDLISINGSHFSATRGNSKVFFTLNSASDDTMEYIACSETSPDYDFWSNEHIRLRIPDGAKSGNIFIETENGRSNFFPIQINTKVGTKTHANKNTYLLSLHGDITNVSSIAEGTLTLRVPKPVYSSLQELIEITQSNPEPTIPDYMGTILHQFPIQKGKTDKLEVNHSFVVLTRSLETNIDPKEVRPYSEKTLDMYYQYTSPNSLIPSNNKDVAQVAKTITKDVTNLYTRAQKIFEYMLKQYSIENNLQENERPIDVVLKSNRIDSYEATILFTSLCRANNIICQPIAGILIDAQLKAKNHWWTEIYLENFGWFPVDIALALGLEYQPFYANENKNANFYFGNIDSQHIAFSRGLNDIKPTSQSGKIVTRNRSYALQTIWEESSAQIQSYSSFWSPIYVNGVY